MDRATYLGPSQYSDVRAAEAALGFKVLEPENTLGRVRLGVYSAPCNPKANAPAAIIVRYGTGETNDLELRVEHWPDAATAAAFVETERLNSEGNADMAGNGYPFAIRAYEGYVRGAVDVPAVYNSDGSKEVGAGIHAAASILVLGVGSDVYILEAEPGLTASDLERIARTIPLP